MASKKEQKTRTYRSKEERTEELEKKIEYHKQCIMTLERKKASIESGRRAGTRTKGLKRLIADAKVSDTQLLEIMSLGDETKIRNKLNEIIEEKSKKN